MITGAHSVIFSKDAEADRAFLRDVLGLPSVDAGRLRSRSRVANSGEPRRSRACDRHAAKAGDGWLIFALPPAEVAVHPARKNDVHEFYLMSDDIRKLVAMLNRRGVACSPVEDRGWGLLTRVSLPGGGSLGIYEPRHATAHARGRRRSARE